jgi:hypothetical protein
MRTLTLKTDIDDFGHEVVLESFWYVFVQEYTIKEIAAVGGNILLHLACCFRRRRKNENE